MEKIGIEMTKFLDAKAFAAYERRVQRPGEERFALRERTAGGDRPPCGLSAILRTALEFRMNSWTLWGSEHL
jgi:hypothetical protein